MCVTYARLCAVCYDNRKVLGFYGVCWEYALSLCNKAILSLSSASHITSTVTHETPIVTKLFETLTGTHETHEVHMTYNERMIAHLERKLRILLACEEAQNKAMKHRNRINNYDV